MCTSVQIAGMVKLMPAAALAAGAAMAAAGMTLTVDPVMVFTRSDCIYKRKPDRGGRIAAAGA